MPSEATKSRNYTQQTSSVAAIRDALVFWLPFPQGICCLLALPQMRVWPICKQIPCGNDNQKSNSKSKNVIPFHLVAVLAASQPPGSSHCT